jgi:lipid A 3-O-deacylase PagL
MNSVAQLIAQPPLACVTGLRRITLPVFFMVVVLLPGLYAQQTSGADQRSASAVDAKPERNELSTFAVLPLANGSLKGVTSDRHFFLFGVSYSRLLLHRRVCDIKWVSEVMPLEFLAEPFFRGTNVQALRAQSPLTETKITYGVGTNPAGADVIFVPGRHWQPFAGVHGGFSYFMHNVLGAEATRFNFMLDGRGGVRFALPRGRSVSVAYMFQHMSNAYISADNPGVDSHMIHLAYSFPLNFGHTMK